MDCASNFHRHVWSNSCDSGHSVSAGLTAPGRGGTLKVNILCCGISNGISIWSYNNNRPCSLKIRQSDKCIDNLTNLLAGEDDRGRNDCSILTVSKPSVMLKNIWKAQQVKYTT